MILTTTNNLASMIFTLEHRDLEYRIDNYVRETVKENVQIALRAPLLQSFKDLSEIEMNEILHHSSKQQQASQSKQPIDDVPTSDAVHISDSKDVGAAHLPKIKTPATWLRPLPEEDRPESPEPGPFLRMIYLNPRTTGQMHSLSPIKIPRKTSYFGRLVIWDHSSNGSAKG
ncbi:hypothetical protein Tco_1405934 [Tanacetum coccineum]